mgnify:CR=1 FL=1
MKTVKREGKTALVTGAASGLGAEFAVLLAKDSYNLVLVDVDGNNLRDVKERVQKTYNVHIKVIEKDLSEPNVAQDIFESINGISLDVLINNAGFGLFGPFCDTEWHRESEMLFLHINTTTQLTKLALKIMLKQGYGKILNVSSLAAFQPGPLMSIYYASKAYILSFSEAIANVVKHTGVTVTVLCPGQTKTSFQATVSKSSLQNQNHFKMACPLRVAKYGYDSMLKGKTVVVPGRVNKFLALISRFIPRNTATSIVRRIQEVNRFKQANYNNS